MKKITKTINLIDTIKLKNSYVGNPQYKIVLDTGEEHKTGANAWYVYQLRSWTTGKYIITYHITPTGRFVIDTLEKEKLKKVLTQRTKWVYL